MRIVVVSSTALFLLAFSGACGDAEHQGQNNNSHHLNNNAPDATAPDPRCGNGFTEAGENCDDGALNGTYGYCDTTCQFTLGCGDGFTNGPEVCDGEAVMSCTQLGFSGGTASCQNCTVIDTSQCELEGWWHIADDPSGDAYGGVVDLARAHFQEMNDQLTFRITATAPFTIQQGVTVVLGDHDWNRGYRFGMLPGGQSYFQVWNSSQGTYLSAPVPPSLTVDTSAVETAGVIFIRIGIADLSGLSLSQNEAIVSFGSHLSAAPAFTDGMPDEAFVGIFWSNSPPTCGDQTAQYPEPCDGIDLRGQTCEALGYASGNLSCQGCERFDISGCLAASDWQVVATDPLGDNTASAFDLGEIEYRILGSLLQIRLLVNAGFDPATEWFGVSLGDSRMQTVELTWRYGQTSFWESTASGWQRLPTPPSLVINAAPARFGEPIVLSIELGDLTNLDVTPQLLRAFLYVSDWFEWTSADAAPDNAMGYLDGLLINWSTGTQTCGNSLVEGTEDCDLWNLNGESCPVYGPMSCDGQCQLDSSGCHSGSCTRWSLVGLDQPDDKLGGLADGNLLEFRVEPDGSRLDFRFTTAAPFSPQQVIAGLQLSDGTHILELRAQQGTPRLRFDDGSGWQDATPVPPSMDIDDGLTVAGGVLTFSLDASDLSTYLTGTGSQVVSAQVVLYSTDLATVYDGTPDLPRTIDWSHREQCWFTLDGSPDAKNDTDGPTDLGAVSYNGAGDWFKVRFDFYSPTILSGEVQAYIYNNTNYEILILDTAGSALYFGYKQFNYGFMLAPASCVTDPPTLFGASDYLVIACPKVDIETAMNPYGFDLDQGDSFRLGAMEYNSSNLRDCLPDGWSDYAFNPFVEIP